MRSDAMTPEERKAAVTAMAARMVWNHLQHNVLHKFSPEDEAEAALAGLETYMDLNQMVFYKP